MEDCYKTAKCIVELVGGKDNVSDLRHCATRLRFILIDQNLAEDERLKALPDVIGIVKSSGQYQVIIGPRVAEVYDAVLKVLGGKIEAHDAMDDPIAAEEDVARASTGNVFNRIADAISAIFVDIIPAIAGAGMLQALLSCLSFSGIVDSASQTYQIVTVFANASFYFLPILIADSAAKKFGCNRYVSMAVMGALLHPTFLQLVSTAKTNGSIIEFFGLPVPLVSYGSSVFPAIISIWVMKYIERFIKKFIPGEFQIILVPMLTFLVMMPIVLLAVGPLGNYIGMGLYYVMLWLGSTLPWLAPMIVGLITPFVIMVGMHFASFIPITVILLASPGYDKIIGIGMLSSNMAIAGACLAVSVMAARDNKMKELGASTAISSFLGICEPALYGVLMPIRSALWASCIGGAAGGLAGGIMGVARYAQAGNSVLALASYIGGDSITNLYAAAFCCAIAFGSACTFCMMALRRTSGRTTIGEGA